MEPRGPSCLHDNEEPTPSCSSPSKCPISWARMKLVSNPQSWRRTQLRRFEHMEYLFAKPARPKSLRVIATPKWEFPITFCAYLHKLRWDLTGLPEYTENVLLLSPRRIILLRVNLMDIPKLLWWKICDIIRTIVETYFSILAFPWKLIMEESTITANVNVWLFSWAVRSSIGEVTLTLIRPLWSLHSPSNVFIASIDEQFFIWNGIFCGPHSICVRQYSHFLV